MEKHGIQQLLKKYLDGNCSAEEVAMIDAFFEQYPNIFSKIERRRMSEIARRNKMRLFVSLQLDPLDIGPAAMSFGAARLQWISAAAVILILVSTALFFFVQPTRRENGAIIPLVAKTVPFGSTKKITFLDGTIMWLNAGSKVRFPEKFIGARREVFLDSGEVYFEVARNRKMPFIVHTHQLITVVLGTHFNIKAYAGEARISVSLIEGKIGLYAERKNVSHPIFLLPNQRVEFDTATQTFMKVMPSDVSESVLWTHGVLSFKDQPLNEVSAALWRAFGMPVKIDSRLTSHTLSGVFSNEPLPRILSLIAKSLHAHAYTMKDYYLIK